MQARFLAKLLFTALSAGFAHAQALQAPQVSAPEKGASVARGKALLSHYQCGSCHTVPGVASARGQVAPTLRAWSRRSYIGGRLPNRPEVLVRWLMEPEALIPGTAMPSMGVSQADAQAMAAYLFTLK